jgi:4-amino-4-deoxy-L-arabinose transferase-like glycosyltransferase
VAVTEGPEAPPVDEPLLTEGNAVRWRGVLVALLGAVAGVLVSASQLSSRVGVPLGALAALVVAVGVLDGMGSFDDRDATDVARVGGPFAAVLVSAAAWWFALRAAVAGAWSPAPVALAVTVPFLLLLVAADRLQCRIRHLPQPDLRDRPGMWLLGLTSLLHLPMLGAHALNDPWETHYGEVAREILSRGDWTSLWWAQDGFFFSKPVLTFWLQALGMAVLGVRYEPGRMLSGVAEGLSPQPAWALRLPVFLLVLLGVGLLYRGVASGYGKRAAFFGGLVLISAPQFALLSRQTMTDMPFVACMAGAIGLVMMAMNASPEERVRAHSVAVLGRRVRLSSFHLVVGAYLLVVVPQVLYLLSQHVTLDGQSLSLAAERFAAGSPGNCDWPGNPPCEAGLAPEVGRFVAGAQALLWAQCAGLVLWLSWGERRVQRLLMLAAWLLVSLSTMAKGPAGLGLPVLATVVFVMARGRWRDLARMEILAGMLIFASAALPWIVAMYVRHGAAFTDRLLFHDMFKRAFRHVHDTNTGVDTSFRYYLWQLGYALFPWVGLAPIAVVRWLRRDAALVGEHRASVDVLLGAWLVIGFALFSLMGTKFHHYALPLIPPIAMSIGVLLAELEAGKGGPEQRAMLGAAAVLAAVITFGVGRDLAFDVPGRASAVRLVNLITYRYGRPWPPGLDFSGTLWLFTIGACLAFLAMIAARARRAAVMALCAVGLACGAWVVNGYLVTISRHYSQRGLFVRYEQEKQGLPGPMVAYQLNWKGENFYRGNELAIFVSTGRAFKDWIAARKIEGTRVFYFVTEPKRVGSLRGELTQAGAGRPSRVEELTGPAENNKFVLVRARF